MAGRLVRLVVLVTAIVSFAVPSSFGVPAYQFAFEDGSGGSWVARTDGTGLFPVTTAYGEELSLTWSPDGRRLAFVSDTHSADTSIKMLDMETGSVTQVWPVGSYATGTWLTYSVCWRDNERLVTIAHDTARKISEVVTIDVRQDSASGARLPIYYYGGLYASAETVDPYSGDLLATIASDDTAHLVRVNPSTGAVKDYSSLDTAAFSPDAMRILSLSTFMEEPPYVHGDYGSFITLWKPGGSVVSEEYFVESFYRLTPQAWSPDGSYAAIEKGGVLYTVGTASLGSPAYLRSGYSAAFRPTVRMSGADRYATSVAVSERHFDPGVEAVVIASGSNFPDALCAAPLAAAYAGPVLLTHPSALSGRLTTELERLNPPTIFIVGGVGAVSSKVQDTLEALPNSPRVVRLGGANRFATSVMIAEELDKKTGGSDTAIACTGQNFPDALAAGPLAAAQGWPIVLTTARETPYPTQEYLDASGVTSTLVVGGEGVLSSGAMTTLPSPERVAGSNRYETCTALADWATGKGLLTYEYTAMATGSNYPDALAAGPAVGTSGGLLLLTSSSSVPEVVASRLKANAAEIRFLEVIGGDAAVSPSVASQLQQVVRQ